MSLFASGIRPAIDAYLEEKSKEVRDYGNYWSASSAGYCMRLNIMRRLGVPPIPEIADDKARTQRVFSSGHIFHEWIQGITKGAGLSIAQELKLQDEELMVRGHIDDLVLISTTSSHDIKPDTAGRLSGTHTLENRPQAVNVLETDLEQKLILYDYKTAHSGSFTYAKGRPEMGHYHRMQMATYMYMLRSKTIVFKTVSFDLAELKEARRMSISKDDLRMDEKQLLWSPELEKDVLEYWTTLNKYWAERKLPPCTCLKLDGGFMGRRSKKGKIYNDYFLDEIPCNIDWYLKWKEANAVSV